MDWGTRVFWGLLAVLLGASVFFARGAASQRALAKAAEATLENGDLVKITQVVDGDSVVFFNFRGDRAIDIHLRTHCDGSYHLFACRIDDRELLAMQCLRPFTVHIKSTEIVFHG